MKSKIIKIQKNKRNGQATITIPKKFIEKLGWDKEILVVKIVQDTLIIKKF